MPDPFLLSHDDTHILPVLHDRLECAATVREAVETLAPRAVVVEVPSSLERLWLQAVGRLPALSFIVFEASEKRSIYLPVHPADPMVEATRLAGERGLALACGDLDVDGYGDWRDPVPDAYAIHRLGLRPVFEAFAATSRAKDPADARRESALAHHAQRLREEHGGPVLVVCGMHHAQAVAAHLPVPQPIPMTLPRRQSARVVHPDPEGLAEVLPGTSLLCRRLGGVALGPRDRRRRAASGGRRPQHRTVSRAVGGQGRRSGPRARRRGACRGEGG